MKSPHSTSRVLLGLALSLGLASSASAAIGDCPIIQTLGKFPNPPASYTNVAKTPINGLWNDPNTWQCGGVPSTDAIVHIPAGATVRINSEEAPDHRFVRVDGDLFMVRTKKTRLDVETLYIGSTGHLVAGLGGARVASNVSAEIVFTGDGDIDLNWDPGQRSRGLFADGEVDLNGAQKLPFTTVLADALASDTRSDLLVEDDVTLQGWEVDDLVLLTGTYFRRGKETREEIVQIKELAQKPGGRAKVSVERLTPTPAPDPNDPPLVGLELDHIRPDGTLALHLANLTRNVILRSKTPDSQEATGPWVKQRGHVMLKNPDVEIRSVVFEDLGRTDKSIPLDDFEFETRPDPTADPDADPDTQPLPIPTGVLVDRSINENHLILNRRGRYTLHFHRNYSEPTPSSSPSIVHDSVVRGTPGWGFVNHSSHVDFQRNVALDCMGAGFVTEAGDELGSFIDNLAVGGGKRSTPADYEYFPNRIVFESRVRPQALSDFAFLGEGFWFQGPALTVRGNVANSNHGTGMMWFTTGSPNVNDLDPAGRPRYTAFPRSAATTVFGASSGGPADIFKPRNWIRTDSNGNDIDNQLVIADLPILEMSDFTSYASYQGFRLRFNNMDSLAWYTDGDHTYDLDIEPIAIPVGTQRLRQSVDDLNLWNTEQGFVARYISHTDISNVTALNRLNFGQAGDQPGCNVNFFIYDSTMDQVDIDGYALGCWIYRGPIANNGGSPVAFPCPDVNGTYEPPGGCANGLTNFTLANFAADYYEHRPVSEFQCRLATATTSTPTSSEMDLTIGLQAPVGPAPESTPVKYLVRYWKTATPEQIEFQQFDTANTTVTVDGLESSTSYRFQVLTGCEEAVADFWSPPTPPASTL